MCTETPKPLRARRAAHRWLVLICFVTSYVLSCCVTQSEVAANRKLSPRVRARLQRQARQRKRDREQRVKRSEDAARSDRVKQLTMEQLSNLVAINLQREVRVFTEITDRLTRIDRLMRPYVGAYVCGVLDNLRPLYVSARRGNLPVAPNSAPSDHEARIRDLINIAFTSQELGDMLQAKVVPMIDDLSRSAEKRIGRIDTLRRALVARHEKLIEQAEQLAIAREHLWELDVPHATASRKATIEGQRQRVSELELHLSQYHLRLRAAIARHRPTQIQLLKDLAESLINFVQADHTNKEAYEAQQADPEYFVPRARALYEQALAQAKDAESAESALAAASVAPFFSDIEPTFLSAGFAIERLTTFGLPNRGARSQLARSLRSKSPNADLQEAMRLYRIEFIRSGGEKTVRREVAKFKRSGGTLEQLRASLHHYTRSSLDAFQSGQIEQETLNLHGRNAYLLKALADSVFMQVAEELWNEI